MRVKHVSDPRLQALFGRIDPRDGGIRPAVRLPNKGLPPIAIVVTAVLLAAALFSVLNSSRTSRKEPAIQRVADDATSEWAVPPLRYIPPAQARVSLPFPSAPLKPSQQIMINPAPAQRSASAPITYARSEPEMILPGPAPAPPARVSVGSPLVVDTGSALTGTGSGATSVSYISPSTQSTARMRASALANRSMTVPQGYLIPAVLETGFDSTKPGFARAIVSRDVRGFDGKNVLIPRGSRLIGEYGSVIVQGQNRAVINWTRLIRPDGMTITIDSPAVDTVGRAGVAAAVNTHFFARVGDALLQSTVDIGRALAGRAITGPVVLVPGNAAAAASDQGLQSNRYVPTLTVRPGTSIGVFVAHDLDFGAPGGAQ